MAIKVPQNQITFKYTSGGEYIIESTYQSYIGHYYEFKGKIFAGKEFSVSALTLLRADSDKVNKLILNPKTATYGIISGAKTYPTSIPAYNYIPTDEEINRGYVIRHFAKKNNTSPDIIIREISETTLNTYKANPNYQFISIVFNFTPGGFSKGIPQDIDKAETIMSGITTFLELDDFVPPTQI
jgi:hypothetical protein